MSNTAIAQIRTMLDNDRMNAQLAVMLEGKAVSVAKFKSVAMTAVVRDPDLLEADRTSLLTACVDAARAGLLPDKRESALVVHSTKKKVLDPKTGGRKEVWVKEVTYMPMIRGIYKLANGSGEVRRIRAHLVRAGDDFRYGYGAVPFCDHVPADADKQGLITHVYAVATLTDGSIDLEVMTLAEVNAVRQQSRQPKGGAWGSDAVPNGEMAKKTVVHRISKRLDLEPAAREAVDKIEGEYDLDAPALPEPPARAPQLPRPTDADDGLSMYDDMDAGHKALATVLGNPESDAVPGKQEAPPALDPKAEKIARDIATMGTARLNEHFDRMPHDQAVAHFPIRTELETIATEADMRKD